ncbi:MAG: HNH endonuclease [Flexilinea sp.]
MRDDFDKKTKDILALRVGSRCSNPNCRKPTNGPQTDESKAINIGVAAHIKAASQSGPRFDTTMTPEERKSIENGIWLCQNCAKLVDNDDRRYTIGLLIEWKRLSEQAALLEVENLILPTETSKSDDVELLRFYSQCFDRPAFQDAFREEGSMESFDRAIEDTITAINTGTLRARDGAILAQAKGKSFIINRNWRNKMDVIVDLLRAIRSRYSLAVRLGQIDLGEEHNGKQWYQIRNMEIADWMDKTRIDAIQMFSELCIEAQIPALFFPRIWRR